MKRDGIPLGEFPLSIVLLINDAAFPWFVLVPKRVGVKDAIDLESADYNQLAFESRIFSLAIREIFAAEKLNVAALGNMTPQLHVHHIVRSKDDAAWPKPVWGFQPLTPYRPEAMEDIRLRLAQARMAEFVPVAGF